LLRMWELALCMVSARLLRLDTRGGYGKGTQRRNKIKIDQPSDGVEVVRVPSVFITFVIVYIVRNGF